MTTGPIVTAFPVQIPTGFTPSDRDGDGVDVNGSNRTCPGYDAASGYRPRWGGGFEAPRGPKALAHRAIDIMAAEGSLLVPPGISEVIDVGDTPKGGHCLYLRDAHGWVWYIAHMRDAPFVKAGDQVDPASTILGYVGRSGNASYDTKTGKKGCPHAHISLTRPPGSSAVRIRRELGVAVRGEKVDPVPFLKPLYDAGGWRR